jgi:hypothetical protein
MSEHIKETENVKSDYIKRRPFFRGSDYFEQHFIVSTGIDCRLPATIYVRVTDRQILTWIQKVTGKKIQVILESISPKFYEQLLRQHVCSKKVQT